MLLDMLLICYSWTCIWPFCFGERRSMALGGKLNLLIIFLYVGIYIGNLYIFTLNLVSPFRKVRLKSRANRLCIFCVMRTHYGHCYVLKQCQVNISRHFITLAFLFRWNCCRRKQSIYKRRTLVTAWVLEMPQEYFTKMFLKELDIWGSLSSWNALADS